MLMRRILHTLGWSTEQVAGVSSHSCKATTISFCSKFGMGEEERKILAYHLSKTSSTIKCYSRDVMVAPLRQMARIFEEIRSGSFLPSGTRANMFPQDDGDSAVDIKVRYYGLMEEISNQRVADEVGSEATSERGFSDLSDYDAEDSAGDQPAVNTSDDVLGDAVDFGGAEENDEQAIICSDFGDANDIPKADSPFEFSAEDELGLAEGSTLNSAALVSVSQVEPEKAKPDSALSDQSSSSSSSDSSSSAQSEAFEELMRPPVLGASASSQDVPVMQNLFKVRGGKYHLCSANSEAHFICGASITPRASRQITSPAFFSPKCPKCFRT